MRIRFFEPHPFLRPHLSQIWIVEDPIGWKPEDIKTIVPNGRMEIVFPYRAALLNRAIVPSSRPAPFQRNPKNTMWVLGVSDRPSIVDSDGPIGVLSAELYPGAAYPFFPADLKEFTNRVTPAADVYGAAGRELQDRLAEEPTPEGKVELLQGFLLGLLGRADYNDEIVRHAVRIIQGHQGLITFGPKRSCDVPRARSVRKRPWPVRGASLPRPRSRSPRAIWAGVRSRSMRHGRHWNGTAIGQTPRTRGISRSGASP